MPEDVYEIRIVGDPSSLAAAARQAEQSLQQLGRAASGPAAQGMRELVEGGGKLRIGFRDASSATRIFVHSLASELNPSVAAAINQSRMLSFALLNFRNVLGAGTIGALALAAGAIEFYTSRAQRMAETQIKANRAAREFDPQSLVTGIRQASIEIEQLTQTVGIRTTKFTGIGAIGGGVAGFLFGGPAGAVVGAGLGAAGGAGLARLLTGMSVEELKATIQLYDQAIGKIVPFERGLAQAAATAARAQGDVARLQVGLAQREMIGRAPRLTETFTGVQTAIEERQGAERAQLEGEYQRERVKMADAGENALAILEAQFNAKRTAMREQHNTQLLQLATEYGQGLLRVTRSIEESAEAIRDIETFEAPEFLRDFQEQLHQLTGGPLGAFDVQLQRTGRQFQSFLSVIGDPAMRRDLEETFQAFEKAQFEKTIRPVIFDLEQLISPEEGRELRKFTEQWRPLIEYIEQTGGASDATRQQLLQLINIRRVMLESEERERPQGAFDTSIEGMLGTREAAIHRSRMQMFREAAEAGVPITEDISRRIEQALSRQQQSKTAAFMARYGETLGGQFADGFDLGLLQFQESLATFGQDSASWTRNIGEHMTQGLEDTFFAVTTNNFRSLVDVGRQAGFAIVREFNRATARLVMRGLVGGQDGGGGGGGILGGLLGGGGGGGGLLGWLGGLFGGGGGPLGASPMAPLPAFEFQYGGIVQKPTLAMIGEAGPEAVVPLDRLGRGGGGREGGVTVINLSNRDELSVIMAQEMAKGREVIVNDVISGLRGNSPIRRGLRRFA